jgi:hypothetical protein
MVVLPIVAAMAAGNNIALPIEHNSAADTA